MLSNSVVLSGKRLRVWTGGSGPGLLLLQSAWGDAEMSWSAVWEELSRSFTVVAPDLPGLGQSDATDGMTLAASARAMKELLDHLGIGKAAVVGNSFGVMIAVEFASVFPERTRCLVAVNGTRMPAIPAFVRKIMAMPFLAPRLSGMMRKSIYSDKAFARAFPDQSRLPAGFIDRIRQFEVQHSEVSFRTFMNQTVPQTRPPVRSALIWGTGDHLVRDAQVLSFRKWLGEPRFLPLEGAGHMPQLEQPGAFTEAVRKAAG